MKITLLALCALATLGIFSSPSAQAAPQVLASVIGEPSTIEGYIADLRSDVLFWVSEGELTPSQGLALTRFLDAALLRYKQGRPAAAITQLQSFISYLGKLMNLNLDEEVGEWLQDEAYWIIFLLNGGEEN